MKGPFTPPARFGIPDDPDELRAREYLMRRRVLIAKNLYERIQGASTSKNSLPGVPE